MSEGYIIVVPASETLEEIQAMRITETNREEVKQWLSGTVHVVIPSDPRDTFILVGTSDAFQYGHQVDVAELGFWLVKIDGEVELYGNEAFALTYRAVECNIVHCTIEEHLGYPA